MKKVIGVISRFFLILIILLIIDWFLIPIIFLHNDACYYHNHDAPFLIDLFFVDSSGHVDPPFNLLNIFSVFAFSIVVSALFMQRSIGQKKSPVKTGPF
jgi:hypothetical protein